MQSNEDEHNKIHKFYHLIFALNPQYIVVVFRRKQLRVVRDMVWRIKKPFNINRIQRILISYHLWAFICLERSRQVVEQPLFDQVIRNPTIGFSSGNTPISKRTGRANSCKSRNLIKIFLKFG